MLEARPEFMQAAIEEAIAARTRGDYAIGAVIVQDDRIIARAMNRSKIDNDATHHAEIIAIQEASRVLGSRYLEDCILYTTHESCPMCASAVIWAKMKGVVSGARIEDMASFAKDNANETWQWRTIAISIREVFAKNDLHPDLIEEFMREECVALFHST